MTDRLDRQQRINRWDQTRIGNATLVLHVDNAAYHIVLDALVRGCIMIGFKNVSVVADKSWQFAIRDLQEYSDAIASSTQIQLIQDRTVRRSISRQPKVHVNLSGKGPFLLRRSLLPDYYNPFLISGAATDRKITWYSEMGDPAYLSTSEFSSFRKKLPGCPGSGLALVLAGSILAEVVRILMPLERWVYSDLAQPIFFPIKTEPAKVSVDQGKKPVLAIVGGGGIGSWLAYAIQSDLSVLNAGHIYIIDNDKVELTNLNRQVLFTAENINSYKAETLANKLKWLLGDKITAINERIEDGDFFDRKGIKPDIIFSCLDAWQPRDLLNVIAKKFRSVLVNAGCDPYSVNAYSYCPGVTPCMDCAMDVKERAANEVERHSCAAAQPSVVFTNMIAAGMMLFLLHNPYASREGILNFDLTFPERLGFIQFNNADRMCGCC